MTLFSKAKDPLREKWEGARCVIYLCISPYLHTYIDYAVYRTGYEEAASIFGADDARSIDYFPSHLKSLTSMYSNIYVDGQAIPSRRSKQKSIIKYLSSTSLPTRLEFDSIIDSLASSKRRNLAPEVARLRSIKSVIEQRLLRAAADISCQAHAKVRFYPCEITLPPSSFVCLPLDDAIH